LYFDKVRILWERSKHTYNHAKFDEAVAKEKIRLRISGKETRARVFRKRTLISAAASIILLLGLGISYLYFSGSGDNRLVAYNSGDRIQEIILPDSSHIWLNENSTLYAPKKFSFNSRKVKLEGEAYFEITRDESKPFKVKAGNTIIKVLGTSFDVKKEKETGNIHVVVSSGKVAFYRAYSLDNDIVLTPGTKGIYHASNGEIIASGNTNQNYLSWKTGRLSFYDTPLNEVCEILSEYYKTSITTNLNDSGLVLTGTFENEDLEQILKTIELTFDVEFTTNNNTILIHD
jgi:ferric-dicitrate binding protein FerR (iron transport regulator)